MFGCFNFSFVYVLFIAITPPTEVVFEFQLYPQMLKTEEIVQCNCSWLWWRMMVATDEFQIESSANSMIIGMQNAFSRSTSVDWRRKKYSYKTMNMPCFEMHKLIRSRWVPQPRKFVCTKFNICNFMNRCQKWPNLNMSRDFSFVEFCFNLFGSIWTGFFYSYSYFNSLTITFVRGEQTDF